MLQYRAENILVVMKEHYQDLLMYDPEGISLDMDHWERQELGEPKLPLEGIGKDLYWPEVLDMIRDMNHNTAPGTDGIHINIFKAMVLEECMAELKRKNQGLDN
jgi:hypothetical protein